jgi:hypothetical protein
MEKLGAGRVFADSYQFFVYDSAFDPLADLPDWDHATNARGYMTADRAIYLGTRAHLNDHWVEIFHSESPPDVASCERALAFNLDIQGDALCLMGPSDDEEDILRFPVPPGAYTLYVLAYNIGNDAFSTGELEDEEDDEDMSDEQLAARTDYERYDLVLVPGHAEHTGVIHGGDELPVGSAETLDD